MKRSTLSLKLLILAAILFVSVPDAIAQFQTQPSIFKDIEPDSLMARIEKLPSVKDVKRLASKDFKDKYRK